MLDLADTTAALLALRGGQLPPRQAALAVASGAVAAALAAAPRAAGRDDVTRIRTMSGTGAPDR